MIHMNRKTIKKLEYTKILKLAAKYAVSSAGKEQILQLHPETEPRRVKRMLNEDFSVENEIALQLYDRYLKGFF